MLNGGIEKKKEQNTNKIKLFISKTIKMYIRGFETEFLFSATLTACFAFLKN